MKKQQDKEQRSKAGWRQLALVWWAAVLGPLVLLLGGVLLALGSELPDEKDLADPRSDLATTILFSNGSQMGQYYRENRVPVGFERISPHVVHALVATEDERYYDHSGVDLRALGRVVKGVVTRSSGQGGGSTISQQLAKMLFPREKLSTLGLVRRKFQEWVIAARIERLYTKDEIIALYLNRFDWINQAVGINSASRVYFDTTPDSLNIEQSAMLVGMLKNPALFNPLRRPDTTLHRRMVVLHQMKKSGYLDQQAYDSLRTLPLDLHFQRVDHSEGLAPYLRETLRKQVGDLLAAKDEEGNYLIAKADGKPYDLYTDGLRIYTTIDKRMQGYAEWAVREHLGTELQNDFWKDLARKKNRPFDFRVSQEEVDGIMNSAKKRSVRYLVLTGKQCGNCERPAAYIRKVKYEGSPHFHCDPAKGGCDNHWPVRTAEEIDTIFATPVPMTVFSWQGDRDTVLSPLDSIRYYKSFLQSGVLALDPHTGFVKAWVGGPDFKHFQYDHVGQARRQVGSTFKPFVYATAIREGMDPCTELPNQKVCFNMPPGQPDWCPENSDNSYGGMVTLKYALSNSVNTITAWLMKQYGPEAVTVLARHMGVKSPMDPVPSLCLGVADLTLLEITGAFSAFANEGVFIEPMVFTRIEDKNGNTIFDVTPRTFEALDQRTAYIMLQLMKGVVDGAYNHSTGKTTGTGMRLRMGWGNRAKYGNIKYPTAGKTGTTQNNSDGWFMGITPDLVTGVWTGADDRSVRFSTTDKGQGANMALPIYGYFMNKVYADTTIDISKGDFPKPLGLDVEVNCRTRTQSNTGGEGDGGVKWD